MGKRGEEGVVMESNYCTALVGVCASTTFRRHEGRRVFGAGLPSKLQINILTIVITMNRSPP